MNDLRRGKELSLVEKQLALETQKKFYFFQVGGLGMKPHSTISQTLCIFSYSIFKLD